MYCRILLGFFLLALLHGDVTITFWQFVLEEERQWQPAVTMLLLLFFHFWFWLSVALADKLCEDLLDEGIVW